MFNSILVGEIPEDIGAQLYVKTKPVVRSRYDGTVRNNMMCRFAKSAG